MCCGVLVYHLFGDQEYEAAVKQMELEKVRVEQEERRKTMGAETEQHQRVRLLPEECVCTVE